MPSLGDPGQTFYNRARTPIPYSRLAKFFLCTFTELQEASIMEVFPFLVWLDSL